MTPETTEQYRTQIDTTANVRELATLDRQVRAEEGDAREKQELVRMIERKTAGFVERVMRRDMGSAMRFAREVNPNARSGGEFALYQLVESTLMAHAVTAVLTEMGQPLEERVLAREADLLREIEETRAHEGSEAFRRYRGLLAEVDSLDTLRLTWSAAIQDENIGGEAELGMLAPIVEARIKVLEAAEEERMIDRRAAEQQEREDQIGTETIRAALVDAEAAHAEAPIVDYEEVYDEEEDDYVARPIRELTPGEQEAETRSRESRDRLYQIALQLRGDRPIQPALPAGD